MCKYSIVIVNYNTYELLLACLNSVYEALDSFSAEVWVVDNASTDDSVELVKRLFPQVQLIVNDTNHGFSWANNQVMRQAKGETWVILNPDTIILPGAFQKLSEGFDLEPSIGVVGPKLLNPDRLVQPSFGKYSSLWTEIFFQFYISFQIPAFTFPIRIPSKFLAKEGLSTHPRC